jgi:hypothetical protein
MTSQAILRARFSELAESLGITLSVRRQTNKYYFTVAGGWKNTNTFLQTSFPNAWITSAGGGEFTYGLPLADVERVLSEMQVDPDWLQSNDAAPLRIAQQIRSEREFAHLPILADALEEGGCSNAEILNHCRTSAPHQQTCWVVELLLGPERKRRRKSPPAREAEAES